MLAVPRVCDRGQYAYRKPIPAEDRQDVTLVRRERLRAAPEDVPDEKAGKGPVRGGTRPEQDGRPVNPRGPVDGDVPRQRNGGADEVQADPSCRVDDITPL